MNKWGVERLFEAMQMVSSTRATLQLMSAIVGMFGRKYGLALKNPKMSQTAKIEGYNTHFQTFPRPELRTPQAAFSGHGRSLERSHMDLIEYVDAFTFILRQF